MREIDIKTTLRQYIADNILMTGVAADLGDDVSLLRRAIIDSTGVIELVTYLEDRFDIKIDDAEMVPANLDSIGRIAAFVARKRLEREDSAA